MVHLFDLVVSDMDIVSKKRRSEIMAAIRGKDTMPELVVRRYLHRMGLRYLLHKNDLPGKPDIVFPTKRACVFVHGCFWHGCRRCVDGKRKVKSRTIFWDTKIRLNRERDKRNQRKLASLGWTSFIIWECEVNSVNRLGALALKLERNLGDGTHLRIMQRRPCFS